VNARLQPACFQGGQLVRVGDDRENLDRQPSRVSSTTSRKMKVSVSMETRDDVRERPVMVGISVAQVGS